MEGGRDEGREINKGGRLRMREIMCIYMYCIEWWLLTVMCMQITRMISLKHRLGIVIPFWRSA